MTTGRMCRWMQWLAGGGLLVSAYLFWGKVTSQFFCPAGDCHAVNESPYAYIGPFPVSLLGVTYYLLLLLLLQFQRDAAGYGFRLLLHLALAGGLAYSLFLTWIELFVLELICFWCVVSCAIVVLLNGLWWGFFARRTGLKS